MGIATASRNIAITEDIYDRLSRMKNPDESFTQVIARLLETKNRPSNHAGAWADMPDDEFARFEAARKDARRLFAESARSGRARP